MIKSNGQLNAFSLYENSTDFEAFRSYLYTNEDMALDALEKQCPPQKSTILEHISTKLVDFWGGYCFSKASRTISSLLYR